MGHTIIGLVVNEGQCTLTHSKDCSGCEAVEPLPDDMLIDELIPPIHLPIITHLDHSECASCGAISAYDEGSPDIWTIDGGTPKPLCDLTA